MSPQRQLLPPHRWPLPSLRALLAPATLLALVLLWFYVDLLHEQVRRGESVRERLRTPAALPGDARPMRLTAAKGRAQPRFGPGQAEAANRASPR